MHFNQCLTLCHLYQHYPGAQVCHLCSNYPPKMHFTWLTWNRFFCTCPHCIAFSFCLPQPWKVENTSHQQFFGPFRLILIVNRETAMLLSAEKTSQQSPWNLRLFVQADLSELFTKTCWGKQQTWWKTNKLYEKQTSASAKLPVTFHQFCSGQ